MVRKGSPVRTREGARCDGGVRRRRCGVRLTRQIPLRRSSGGRERPAHNRGSRWFDFHPPLRDLNDEGEGTAMAKEKFRADQATRQRRHDGPHRSRQDHAHRRDHEGTLARRRPTTRTRLRRDRQGAPGAGTRPSPSPSPTSSTSRTSRHYAHVDCPGTPTTSRT